MASSGDASHTGDGLAEVLAMLARAIEKLAGALDDGAGEECEEGDGEQSDGASQDEKYEEDADMSPRTRATPPAESFPAGLKRKRSDWWHELDRLQTSGQTRGVNSQDPTLLQTLRSPSVTAVLGSASRK